MYLTQLARKKIYPDASVSETLNDLQIERSFLTSSKDTVAAALDEESKALQIIPEDKIHRRNPNAVRLEIPAYDDLFPETDLEDLKFSEMPGLQNTEQWKRIASRIGQGSLPLSREYYQQATSILNSSHEPMPEVLYAYPHANNLTNEPNGSFSPSVIVKKSHTKVGIAAVLMTITIAIIIGVVVAVILVRKPKETTTDWYYGSVQVKAPFDSALLSLTSTLARNYQREFCSLVTNTLSDLRTKYAIFLSDCSVSGFRNGSIIGDFVLGFTRYQNDTRLNAFLNRTLVNRQLFGGSILLLVFNRTVSSHNDLDYSADYDDNSNHLAKSSPNSTGALEQF